MNTQNELMNIVESSKSRKSNISRHHTSTRDEKDASFVSTPHTFVKRASNYGSNNSSQNNKSQRHREDKTNDQYGQKPQIAEISQHNNKGQQNMDLIAIHPMQDSFHRGELNIDVESSVKDHKYSSDLGHATNLKSGTTPNESLLHHNESNNMANLLGIAHEDYIGLIQSKQGMVLDSNKASTTLGEFGETQKKFFNKDALLSSELYTSRQLDGDLGPGSVSLDSQEGDGVTLDTHRNLASSIEALSSELMDFIKQLNKTKRVHKEADNPLNKMDDLELRLKAAQIRRNDLEEQGEMEYRIRQSNLSPTANAKSSTARFNNKFKTFNCENLEQMSNQQSGPQFTKISDISPKSMASTSSPLVNPNQIVVIDLKNIDQQWKEANLKQIRRESIIQSKLEAVLNNEYEEQITLNRIRASEKLIERGVYAQLLNAQEEEDSDTATDPTPPIPEQPMAKGDGRPKQLSFTVLQKSPRFREKQNHVHQGPININKVVRSSQESKSEEEETLFQTTQLIDQFQNSAISRKSSIDKKLKDLDTLCLIREHNRPRKNPTTVQKMSRKGSSNAEQLPAAPLSLINMSSQDIVDTYPTQQQVQSRHLQFTESDYSKQQRNLLQQPDDLNSTAAMPSARKSKVEMPAAIMPQAIQKPQDNTDQNYIVNNTFYNKRSNLKANNEYWYKQQQQAKSPTSVTNITENTFYVNHGNEAQATRHDTLTLFNPMQISPRYYQNFEDKQKATNIGIGTQANFSANNSTYEIKQKQPQTQNASPCPQILNMMDPYSNAPQYDASVQPYHKTSKFFPIQLKGTKNFNTTQQGQNFWLRKKKNRSITPTINTIENETNDLQLPILIQKSTNQQYAKDQNKDRVRAMNQFPQTNFMFKWLDESAIPAPPMTHKIQHRHNMPDLETPNKKAANVQIEVQLLNTDSKDQDLGITAGELQQMNETMYRHRNQHHGHNQTTGLSRSRLQDQEHEQLEAVVAAIQLQERQQVMNMAYNNQKSIKIDQKSKQYNQTIGGLQQTNKTQSANESTKGREYMTKSLKKIQHVNQDSEMPSEYASVNINRPSATTIDMSPVAPKVEIKRQQFNHDVSHLISKKPQQDYNSNTIEDYSFQTSSAFSQIKKQNMLRGVRRTRSTIGNYPKKVINQDMYHVHMRMRNQPSSTIQAQSKYRNQFNAKFDNYYDNHNLASTNAFRSSYARDTLDSDFSVPKVARAQIDKSGQILQIASQLQNFQHATKSQLEVLNKYEKLKSNTSNMRNLTALSTLKYLDQADKQGSWGQIYNQNDVYKNASAAQFRAGEGHQEEYPSPISINKISSEMIQINNRQKVDSAAQVSSSSTEQAEQHTAVAQQNITIELSVRSQMQRQYQKKNFKKFTLKNGRPVKLKKQDSYKDLRLRNIQDISKTVFQSRTLVAKKPQEIRNTSQQCPYDSLGSTNGKPMSTISTSYSRQYERLFGKNGLQAVIQSDGYTQTPIPLLTAIAQPNTAAYHHHTPNPNVNIKSNFGGIIDPQQLLMENSDEHASLGPNTLQDHGTFYTPQKQPSPIKTPATVTSPNKIQSMDSGTGMSAGAADNIGGLGGIKMDVNVISLNKLHEVNIFSQEQNGSSSIKTDTKEWRLKN